MRTSSDRILTTHVGSLPRPDDLIEANRSRESGEATDEAGFQNNLRAAVADVVQRQRDLGIDVPGDGEFGKSMGHRVNYGAWWSYCVQPARRPRSRRAGHARRGAAAVQPGRGRADELRRSARSSASSRPRTRILNQA